MLSAISLVAAYDLERGAMLDPWDDYHDALLRRIELDVVGGAVSIHLLAYPDPNARDRTPVVLSFLDVTALTVTADLTELARNAFAGHVNHAHIADGPGTSYVYLVEGYVAVTSKAAPRS